MEPLRARSVDSCAGECLDCHRACISTLEYCIGKGGEFANPDLLRALRICGEICRTNAYILESRSEFFSQVSTICAEACDACADLCEKIEDEKLSQCARSCRDCSDACLAMATSRAA